MHFRHARAGAFCFLLSFVLAGCASHRGATSAATPTVASATPASVVQAPSGDAPRDLGPLLAPIIARAKIPGAAAAVLRGDRIVAQGVAGVRKRGAPERVTIHDQFEICSAAKSMTATLAAQLVEEGKLGWETPLGEIFASSMAKVDPAWQHVTVRQALAHRAGLEDHFVLFLRTVWSTDGSAAEQRRAMVTKLLSRPPDFAPGSRFFYNSADYLVVASALEIVAGRPWEELVAERIFASLGMASAGFGPPGAQGKVDQPRGHGAVLRGLLGPGATAFEPGASGADFPLAAAPAGLVHVSVPDWAKYASWHLRGDPHNPHARATRLNPESFGVLHETLVDHYALGWFTGVRPWAKGNRADDRGRVLYHEGENGRWTSVIWLAPEIDFGIVIVCNRGAVREAVDQIAGALVAEFAKKPETVATP